MNKIFASALMAAALVGGVSEADACTNFIVGCQDSWQPVLFIYVYLALSPQQPMAGSGYRFCRQNSCCLLQGLWLR